MRRPTGTSWRGAARSAALGIACAILAAACGYDHDQWHGRTRAELVHAWGPPLEERALSNAQTWVTIAYTPADRDGAAPCYMVYELDAARVIRASFTVGC